MSSLRASAQRQAPASASKSKLPINHTPTSSTLPTGNSNSATNIRQKTQSILNAILNKLEKILTSIPFCQRILARIHPHHRRNVLQVVLVSLLFVLAFFGTQPTHAHIGNLQHGQQVLKMKNITVVVMNHARPGNLLHSELLPTLLQHPHISEVLLLHSNPQTAFQYDHPKVKNMNATMENELYGLSLRFVFCEQTQNPWIMMVDDDMLVPTLTLDALIHEFASNPHRIVGRFGRYLSHVRRTGLVTHGYQTINAKGGTEVILTKIMLLERDICQQFQEFAQQTDIMSTTLLQQSRPKWNGEDIFMSLVANHVYSSSANYSTQTRKKAQRGINNYAMPWLDVDDVGDQYKNTTGTLDVSGNFHGIREPWTYRPWNKSWRENFQKAYWHLAYRGLLWQEAKKRLLALKKR